MSSGIEKLATGVPGLEIISYGGIPRGRTTLIHLDAYRLESFQQIDDLLLADFLVSPWCLAIEWPEKIAEWVPPGALHLELGITADEKHTLRLRS